jgi:hypothetical protein
VASEPILDGVTGVTADGTSWAEVTATIKPADYEQFKIVLGRSLKVNRNRSRRTAQRLLDELIEDVVPKIQDVREAWEEQT